MCICVVVLHLTILFSLRSLLGDLFAWLDYLSGTNKSFIKGRDSLIEILELRILSPCLPVSLSLLLRYQQVHFIRNPGFFWAMSLFFGLFCCLVCALLFVFMVILCMKPYGKVFWMHPFGLVIDDLFLARRVMLTVWLLRKFWYSCLFQQR